MKTIVISGISIYEGGPLSIYKDFLDSIVSNKLYKNNDVIAFVYKKELFQDYAQFIDIRELPKSRSNYLMRLWYEYIYFYLFSLKNKVDIWFSIHDVTPNVRAKKRYVYCHNALPFYKLSKAEMKSSRSLKWFGILYKYLYRINLKKNTAIIVQQKWLKDKFMEYYDVDNVIVSYPNAGNELPKQELQAQINKKNTFFYPSFPRVFKNFELICEAAAILLKRGIKDFEIILTLKGNENAYSENVVSNYKHISNIIFTGLLSRKEVFNYYSTSDYLIFPSKLETWGLPITEFSKTGKPMLLADLEYAKETIHSYGQVLFFDVNKPEELADLMEGILKNKLTWPEFHSDYEPDFYSWQELSLSLIRG